MSDSERENLRAVKETDIRNKTDICRLMVNRRWVSPETVMPPAA